MLDSRADLVAFLNDVHNDVNRRLGKREFTLEEHYRAYSPRRVADGSFAFFATTALYAAFVVTVMYVSKLRRSKRPR